jgi:two-component system, response regulator PdtaR
MSQVCPPDSNLLKGFSILVVEDSWQVAKAVKGWLELHEVDVIGPVATVREARRHIDMRRPHAALVDVNLKGELAWDLIDDMANVGIDVVVTTGYSQLKVTTRAAVVHLQKPYLAAELLSALTDIAGRRR